MKTIKVHDKDVGYVITRKPVKNINIRVKGDGVIYISADRRVSENYILKVLKEKESFIISALEYMESKREKEIKRSDYVFYLGKKYRINMIDSKTEKITLDQNDFNIYTRAAPDDENISLLIKNWKLKKCAELYKKINSEVFNDFIKHGIDVPHSVITIKDMKSRWGSCNVKTGRISMNLNLIDYPMECIYSVFYHEYMHYRHSDHSKNFYKDLEEIFPDYRKYHDILKKTEL